jgi:hypothetical protein
MGYDFYGNGQRLSVNIFWIARLRGLMQRIGLFDLEAAPPKGWEPPEAWWELPFDHPTFRRQSTLEDESCLGPLIPRYKLSSNDHLWVSPAEITTTLEALERVPEAAVRSAMEEVIHGLKEAPPSSEVTKRRLDTFDELWSKWISFLRATAPRGFRVG